MSQQITIELNDEDLRHLGELFDGARRKAESTDPSEILDKARALVAQSLAGNPPAFVESRVRGLEKLIAMVEDDAWELPEPERNRALAVLAYFVDSNDVIPDAIPVLGMLDDAIAADIALRALQHELDTYEEFCAFRDAEAQRRENEGRPTDITKEDWLADKRAALHSRLRDHRVGDAQLWHNMMFNY